MANPLLNPHTGQPVSFDPLWGDGRRPVVDIEQLRPFLEQAGVWDQFRGTSAAPSFDGSGDRGSARAAANAYEEWARGLNWDALQGYGMGDSRQDYYVTKHLQTPDGQVISGEPVYNRESWNSDDWKDLAVNSALVLGGGYLAGNALAGAGFGAGAGSGGIPLSAAEMGVGSFPAGMEGFSFMPAGGAAAEGAAVGGGLTAGAGSLYAPAGFAGGTGSALAGAAGAGAAGGAAGGLGGLLSTLGSANSLANLGSAAIGLYGQNKAIGAMGDATQQANDFNRYAFDTIRADNKPLVDMRNSVLPQIQGLLANPGSITSDPGYQFQFNEGQKALNNGAAARGMTYSGAQGKALQRYGNDFASTKLDDSLRRLQSVAGLGQVGSSSNNAATANYANNAGNNALNMGNARGSVYGNMANIGGNALSGIFNQWQWDQVNGRGG